MKFNETLLKLIDVVLQARSDIQEILHLFRPHLHSHEVQVEVSTEIVTKILATNELQCSR